MEVDMAKKTSAPARADTEPEPEQSEVARATSQQNEGTLADKVARRRARQRRPS
jgi:hypothetical protein